MSRWTSEQDARLLKLRADGLTMQECGALLGCSRYAAKHRLERLRKAGVSTPSPNGPWPAERVEALKALWTQGLSGSEVGKHIGATHCAVIGMVTRLGLRRSAAAVREAARLGLRNDRSGGYRHPLAASAQPRLPPENPNDVATIFGCENLKRHHCRWPIGDPAQPGFGFCGDHADDGRYCRGHTRRARASEQPQKRDMRPPADYHVISRAQAEQRILERAGLA